MNVAPISVSAPWSSAWRRRSPPATPPRRVRSRSIPTRGRILFRGKPLAGALVVFLADPSPPTRCPGRRPDGRRRPVQGPYLSRGRRGAGRQVSARRLVQPKGRRDRRPAPPRTPTSCPRRPPRHELRRPREERLDGRGQARRQRIARDRSEGGRRAFEQAGRPRSRPGLARSPRPPIMPFRSIASRPDRLSSSSPGSRRPATGRGSTRSRSSAPTTPTTSRRIRTSWPSSRRPGRSGPRSLDYTHRPLAEQFSRTRHPPGRAGRVRRPRGRPLRRAGRAEDPQGDGTSTRAPIPTRAGRSGSRDSRCSTSRTSTTGRTAPTFVDALTQVRDWSTPTPGTSRSSSSSSSRTRRSPHCRLAPGPVRQGDARRARRRDPSASSTAAAILAPDDLRGNSETLPEAIKDRGLADPGSSPGQGDVRARQRGGDPRPLPRRPPRAPGPAAVRERRPGPPGRRLDEGQRPGRRLRPDPRRSSAPASSSGPGPTPTRPRPARTTRPAATRPWPAGPSSSAPTTPSPAPAFSPIASGSPAASRPGRIRSIGDRDGSDPEGSTNKNPSK